MTWNSTKTFVAGDGPWTAAIMNQYVRDNLQYCRDVERVGSWVGYAAVQTLSSNGNYFNLTGAKVAFRKRQAGSFLKFDWSWGFYTDVANTTHQFAIALDNGSSITTYAGPGLLVNQTTVHKFVMMSTSTGFAGPYPPIGMYIAQLQQKTLAGTGQYHSDANAYGKLEVYECFLNS